MPNAENANSLRKAYADFGRLIVSGRPAQAGGQAEQFLVQATDDERHGVTSYSHAVMKGCVRGESAQEIGLTLNYLVAKRLADKAKMDQLKTAE